MQLRIVLNTILHERENAVNLMAPDCGSWGVPSRGTSGRTFFNYLGNLEYGFVTNGNSMISRNFDLQTVMFFYQVFLAVSSSDKRDFESLTRGHEMP